MGSQSGHILCREIQTKDPYVQCTINFYMYDYNSEKSDYFIDSIRFSKFFPRPQHLVEMMGDVWKFKQRFSWHPVVLFYTVSFLEITERFSVCNFY
jgi:hypothetical protein